MAKGVINLQKESGGVTKITSTDGVSNTEVVLPESGIVAKTSDINTAGVELKTIATGTATFDAVTNTVTFSGLSVEEIENFAQVEIGDVLQYSNATDTKNNSEFTVEVLTQKWANGVSITAGQQRKSIATNITYTALTSGTTSGTDVTNDIGVSWEIATSETIIVNQAHANKGTSKNVATRSGDTGVTVKLLAKWYNAPLGLGQGWVNVLSSRAVATNYPNNTKRTFKASIVGTSGTGANTHLIRVNGSIIAQSEPRSSSSLSAAYFVTAEIPNDLNYLVQSGMTIHLWAELR